MSGPVVRLGAGLLGAAALLVATPAPAPLCVDAKGHKVYQQSPCGELYIKSGIEPVKGDALTEKDVLETVRRFDAALSKRDARAVAEFLDDDFKAVIYESTKDAPPRRLEGYNRRTFLKAFNRTVDVVTTYQATRSNCKVTIKDDVGIAECDNAEAFTVTSHTGDFRSKDKTSVVVRDGTLLINAIEQYQSKAEITTHQAK